MDDKVLPGLQAQVQPIALAHGVEVELVILGIGLLERDLSMLCDPALPERMERLDAMLPKDGQQALWESVGFLRAKRHALARE